MADPNIQNVIAGVESALVLRRAPRLRADILAALESIPKLERERERLHSWVGLMELLDEHYPAEVFGGTAESPDMGVSLVRLVRAVDAERVRADRLEAAARPVAYASTGVCGNCTCPGGRHAPECPVLALRAALAPTAEGPRLRGIGTNEDGDAIAVYEDGSRVNLEDPALAPTPAEGGQ